MNDAQRVEMLSDFTEETIRKLTAATNFYRLGLVRQAFAAIAHGVLAQVKRADDRAEVRRLMYNVSEACAVAFDRIDVEQAAATLSAQDSL